MRYLLYTYLLILFFVLCCAGNLSAGQSVDIFTEARLPDKLALSQYKISVREHLINISGIEKDSFITIFNASGRNIYKSIVGSSAVLIPLKSKGVYIVRIQTGKSVFTQKILVP